MENKIMAVISTCTNTMQRVNALRKIGLEPYERSRVKGVKTLQKTTVKRVELIYLGSTKLISDWSNKGWFVALT